MNHHLGMVGGGLSLLALLSSFASGTTTTTNSFVKKTIDVYTGNAIYVSSTGDDENNNGLTKDNPVKTMKKAFDLVDDYGTIVVTDSIAITRGQEFFAPKNVKITSKYNGEDYTSTAVWTHSADTFFQGSVYLDDIKIQGYGTNGFIANGYDFHVGANVTCTGTDYINIIGGYAPLKETVNENNPPVYKKGANVVVEGGSNWDIFACGSNAFASCGDQILQDEDVNVTIKGAANVHSLYGALSDRTTAPSSGGKVVGDGSVSTIGNVNINVEDTAYIKQFTLASDAQCNSRVKQLDGCTMTVNIRDNTTIGRIIGGSLYSYQSAGLTTVGPETFLNNVVVNYYSGDVQDFTIGGVEQFLPSAPYTKENTGCNEVIDNFHLNLYANFTTAINPGYSLDAGKGHSELSSVNVENAIVTIYNGSTFEYEPLTNPFYQTTYGVYPYELKNRTVCYMDSGDKEAPMNVPESFNPTSIEFGTDGGNKESVENNVFCTETDMEISNIKTDDSNFTIILKGDEVPVITATDSISSTGGKFNLSFKKSDGTSYQPEEGTVVFKVPAVETDEEKHAIEALFLLEGMDEGYCVEYVEGVDGSGNPIGTLVIKARTAPEVLYRVEHYQEQLDGSFVLAETENDLVGASGDTVTGTAKAYEHYHLDESNENAVTSLLLDSEADAANNVLKLYYKLDTHKVTFNANVYGGFAGGETKIVAEYRYGATLPTPEIICNEGYVFDYWVDVNGNKVTELPTTVTEDMMFTAVWKLVPEEPEDPIESEEPTGETTPESTSNNKKVGYIILHVIVGLILGAGATIAAFFTKKKLAKRHQNKSKDNDNK